MRNPYVKSDEELFRLLVLGGMTLAFATAWFFAAMAQASPILQVELLIPTILLVLTFRAEVFRPARKP